MIAVIIVIIVENAEEHQTPAEYNFRVLHRCRL